MNKTWKTGILLITLAIPVFIWLFLKYFGANSFDLPIFYEQGLDSLTDCVSDSKPHKLPAFTFHDTSSKAFASNDFDDKIVISYFLPENCSDSCQLVLERLATIQNNLSDLEALNIVVFANGKYHAGTLKNLEKQYNVNPGVWNFVLGNDVEVKQLKRCGFVLSSLPNHTVILTDAEKRIRGYYQAAELEEIDRLKGEVKILKYMQDVANHD